jgi:hypothetical protein
VHFSELPISRATIVLKYQQWCDCPESLVILYAFINPFFCETLVCAFTVIKTFALFIHIKIIMQPFITTYG